MSIMFVLYNPNIDDPISNMVPRGERTVNALESIQDRIMKKGAKELLEEFRLEEDTFRQAQEAYEDLQQCEWDVLAEATTVAWSYKLEQEEWQSEIRQAEKEEKDHE